MLRIGYYSSTEAHELETTNALLEARCEVVRSEEPGSMTDRPTLWATIRFMASGDRLVIRSLSALGHPAEVVQVIDSLSAREAVLEVLEPPFSSLGPAGHALRAALALSPDVSGQQAKHPTRRDTNGLERTGLRSSNIAAE